MKISTSNVKSNAFTLIFFFSLTIIGTLLHECGHFAAMSYFGFKPTLHFSSTSFGNAIGLNKINYFIILISGPLVNMFIGSLSFFILIRKRNEFKFLKKIIFISFSFFWSRQVVIFLFDLIIFFLKGSSNTHKNSSDEVRMALVIGLPTYIFTTIFGLIGIIICLYSVFIVLSKPDWLRFIVCGIFGSILGYYTWFYLLGKIIMP